MKEFFNAKHKSYSRHNKKYYGYRPVDKPQRPDIEVCPHFVYKKSYKKPPAYGSDNNAGISDYIVIEAVVGVKEVKPGKESDYEE